MRPYDVTGLINKTIGGVSKGGNADASLDSTMQDGHKWRTVLVGKERQCVRSKRRDMISKRRSVVPHVTS